MWFDRILQAMEARQRIFSEELSVLNDSVCKHEKLVGIL